MARSQCGHHPTPGLRLRTKRPILKVREESALLPRIPRFGGVS